MRLRQILEANFFTNQADRYGPPPEDLRANPKDIIGRGLFAQVQDADGGNSVDRISNEYKKTSSEVFYELYTKWLVKHPDYQNNPHFPRIFDIETYHLKYSTIGRYNLEKLYPIIQKNNNRGSVGHHILLAAAKQLLHISEKEFLDEFSYLSALRGPAAVKNISELDRYEQDFPFKYESYIKEMSMKLIVNPIQHLAGGSQEPTKYVVKQETMIKAIDLITKFKSKLAAKGLPIKYDLHDENMMYRLGKGAPTVVITDPFW